jgi:hypothetical protein
MDKRHHTFAIILVIVLLVLSGITLQWAGIGVMPQRQAAQVGGIAVGTTPKPFLFWLFSSGTPFGLSLTEQNKFAPVTLGHYSASETEPASVGYGVQWLNYRNTLAQANILAGNPVPLIGMRVSAVTSSNPVDPTLYPWTRQDNVYCNNPNAVGRSAEAYDVYLGSIRPDTHSFHRQVDPALISPSSFQPRYLTDVPDAWWQPYGAGDSALWPFDFFRSRGWINDATPLYCRPTIKIGSPAVRSFVASTTIRLLNAYAGANTVSFDNASMYHNEQYNSHPGKGVAGSPYQTVSPNQDFIGYLDYIRSALNQNGKKLLVNSGIDAYQLFGGHVDAIYTEDDGINRLMTPADIAAHLVAYKYLTDHNTKVFVQYRGEEPPPAGVVGSFSNFGSNRADTEFFLAASMLVYENGKYAFSPNLHSAQTLRFWEDFYLPTAAGVPLGSYQQPAAIPNFYYRNFSNATVILNANDHDLYLSDAQLSSLGLAGHNFPHRLTAKQGLITIHDCSTLTSLDSLFSSWCGQKYVTHPEPPPPTTGDANCNRDTSTADLVGDRDAFYLAATNSVAYATQYGYCGVMASALDLDNNSTVNLADYTQWFRSVYSPRRGDANCDGLVTDAGDRAPFLLAFDTSASQYQSQYPQCATSGLRVYLNDMDDNGMVNNADLSRFDSSVGHVGNPPTPGMRGDVTCDGYVDNFDINPFVEGVVDPTGYGFPLCGGDFTTSDLNCNGRVDNFDIGLFVVRLVEGQAAYETERAALGYSCPAS